MASGYQVNGTDLYTYFQQPFTGSTNTSITDYKVSGSALSLVSLSSTPTTAVTASGFVSAALGGDISTYIAGPVGEDIYTTPGTSFTWTVPTGVTSICILCVGGSGGNWSRCTQGNSSWFGGTSTTPIVTAPGTVICYAGGGSGTGSGSGNGTEWYGNNSVTNTPITQYTGAVSNAGGSGAALSNGGGGGAGGYSGTGGVGGGTGVAGTGGAGGGGNTGRGGGGVGLYGAGANGAANGGGGSGGQIAITATGGLYGGGWCYGSVAGGYGGGVGVWLMLIIIQ